MYPVHAVTFGQSTDADDLLLEEEAIEAIEEYLRTEAAFGGVIGWSPVTPGPPPIYTARLGGQFINRAPVRLARPAEEGMPQKQDTRQTSNTERVSIVLNALLRRTEIIRVGVQDFRLSWIPPQFAGVDAPIGTLFLDTTTGLLSIKDINGVVIPIGGSGGGGGSGTVTSFSFTNANGFTGSVATATTTPNLTLTLGEVDGGGA